LAAPDYKKGLHRKYWGTDIPCCLLNLTAACSLSGQRCQPKTKIQAMLKNEIRQDGD
jgi:hypothetical protein